ncbi:MAG TPA: hypothetical protein PLO08_11660 [Alicycliphilus sp.]|nr:hypothetical protein [Acidovorax temperans]HRM94256.1 hypothetical protein [Alicycliphilus sp.]
MTAETQGRVRFGKLAAEYCAKYLPIQVLESRAGFYIGTADHEGPVSRESEYFRTRDAAQHAFAKGLWMQRQWP